ncbi:MAG TPA: hypothetical protein VH186_04195 [Chloroflexia bacterium]|nr:hypothetical protein [Chloroflexia bacterium]
MGTFRNLFDVLREDSYQEIEEEASREVTVALAGNNTEIRNRLHDSLSTRLESLWTPSPFRLVDSNERPTAEGDEDSGMLIYALYQGDRIPTEKKRWLSDLARSSSVKVMVVAIDRNSGKDFNRESGVSRRLQSFNPLRLVGGKETNASNAAADGAAFNSPEAEVRSNWLVELDNLAQEARQNLTVVQLSGLETWELEAELLPLIVQRLSGRELALARRAPIFRNTVAGHLIGKTSRANAETVLLANVTAGIPILSGFFGSGADFVFLTKNQFELSHRLASVYGQKRDSRVEVYLEVAPILGAAFLWKAISSAASNRVPVFIATPIKAAIAYAATTVVGRVAQVYYASGRKAPAQVAAMMRNLFEQLTGLSARKVDKDEPGSTPRRLRSS